MTVCLFRGSYGRGAEALQVEAEREIHKEREKVGRRHLKKERRGKEMGRGEKMRKTSTAE